MTDQLYNDLVKRLSEAYNIHEDDWRPGFVSCLPRELERLFAERREAAQAILALIKEKREARSNALEEAARWHDERRKNTPDAFEMEFHEVSAAAIRALTPPSPGEST